MQVLYYLLIKPISMLPLSVSYLLSDTLYYVLYYVVGYRKTVVRSNIESTLGHLSSKEQDAVIKAFYRHFCDIIIESVRLFSISTEELKRRLVVDNPEVVDAFYERGSSILVAGGHYGNWEMLAMLINALIDHQVVGIYTPLRNAFMGRKIAKSRSRYGVHLLAKKEVKAFFATDNGPLFAVFFGVDQSPGRGRQAYETLFLGRPTRVQYGIEKYAVEQNLPVVYFDIDRVSRGYYKVRFKVLTEKPTELPYGAITELHCAAIEEQIMRAPAYWLWSHKRWKGMERPPH